MVACTNPACTGKANLENLTTLIFTHMPGYPDQSNQLLHLPSIPLLQEGVTPLQLATYCPPH